jgi:acyl carrier protein
MADKRDEILSGIKEHLTTRGVDAGSVTFQADLADDLDLDSLDTVELTLGLEERFGIEIPDSDLEAVRTVSDAVDLIEAKLAVGA